MVFTSDVFLFHCFDVGYPFHYLSLFLWTLSDYSLFFDLIQLLVKSGVREQNYIGNSNSIPESVLRGRLQT